MANNVLIGDINDYDGNIVFDEVFATPTDYKNSWGVMDDNQFVTYTEDAQPIYLTSNTFWSPFNTDVTYSFQVDTKTVNDVVIGDLELYKGSDALKFDGVDDYCDTGILTSSLLDGTHKVTAKYTDDMSTDRSIFGDDSSGFQLRFDTGPNIYLFQYRTLATSYEFILGTAPTGGYDEFELKVSGSSVELIINSVSQGTINDFDGAYINSTTKIGVAQNRYWVGEISQYSYTSNVDGLVFSYIQNGDFGSATLIDHSGNGNDGTINGATWNKQGVDSTYPDPATYKASWVSPMEQAQLVRYVDPNTTFYDTNNVYWNDYNIDSVYSFNVNSTKGSYNGSIVDNNFKLKQGLYL